MASDVRGRRKTKIGVVVSSKMEKTVVVRVERVTNKIRNLPKVRDSSKYYAHNELDVKEGDTVRIQETRPLSKTKRWRVVGRVN
ncbi:30S ribosomal protein S17 [Chlamydia trachomatis]|uniref:30S ribosomal protein S17 n=1 Tax=Chlamydia trachomatis TaxID=813 RepID=UPI00061C5288|nr:30S ribosomal protein S17 [Chlamydia trachomatis]CRH26212.1 30S ribosomal protein S17 [Chlamydia trachomatis]